MANGDEHWKETAWRELADHHIFKAFERTREGPHGKSGRFIVLDAPDWAVVIPVLERAGERTILAIRQFRHGAGRSMTEFPGGVVEPGEDPAAAAARELLEETGYRAARIVPLGSCNPNPAFMSNTIHAFAATGLTLVAEQSLDEHEIIELEELTEEELFARVGDPPWSHALMVTAAWYYRRWREREMGIGNFSTEPQRR